MENKLTHNTDISCEVVLGLEDDLAAGLSSGAENYKALIKYIPQDYLDNFLGWFGQEAIERYINKVNKHMKTS